VRGVSGCRLVAPCEVLVGEFGGMQRSSVKSNAVLPRLGLVERFDCASNCLSNCH
jgi:hypothetical protein